MNNQRRLCHFHKRVRELQQLPVPPPRRRPRGQKQQDQKTQTLTLSKEFDLRVAGDDAVVC